MSMTRPQYSYTKLSDFVAFLKLSQNYLEKVDASDLGDWTDEGKIVNAGYNNYTIYWQWYKEIGYGSYQAQAYCAGYVSIMFVNAFGLETAKKLLCGDLYIYCPTGYSNFNNKSRIYSTPQPLDVVFFWSTSLNRWGHTGIVISVDSDGKGYTTIEANTSSGNDVVVRNGGATTVKHYTLGQRTEAFGRPDYASYGITDDVSGASTTTLETYDVATGTNGVTIVVDSTLNVRSYPSTGSVISSLSNGNKVKPSKKTFVNGAAWWYIDSLGGWISAKYAQGWLYESNRWWYVLPGYKWYAQQFATIDGALYYFDASGYMFEGSLTAATDSNGAIQITSLVSNS